MIIDNKTADILEEAFTMLKDCGYEPSHALNQAISTINAIEVTNTNVEKEQYLQKFGELCWDTVMDNAISEEDLYEMIPYLAEYMNVRQSTDIFKRAMSHYLYKY